MAINTDALKRMRERKGNIVTEIVTGSDAEPEVREKNNDAELVVAPPADKGIEVVPGEAIKKSRAKADKLKVDKKASVAGALHITSRISQDFDRDIGLYCIQNRVKKNDLVISSVARVIGYNCEKVPLERDNCRVSITTETKTKSLYARVSDDFKSAVKLFIYEMKETDAGFNEAFLVAQSVAEMIGYKRKMKF